MSREPDVYIKEIDSMTNGVRLFMTKTRSKIGSKDMEFMLRSKNLNWVLRKEIRETDDKELKVRLKWVHAFWWNRVHWLDTFASHRLSKKGLLRRIDNGGKTLRRLIRDEISYTDLHPKFREAVEKLSSAIDPEKKIKVKLNEKDSEIGKMAEGE